MPMTKRLRRALEALAGQLAPGPNEARLETVVDAATNEALLALAEDLGGGNGKRSAAARLLLQKGAQTMLAESRTAA